MKETNGEKARTRERNLRWMEALWEGTSTTASEENQKEEVLAVFRALVRESGARGRFASTCPGNRFGRRKLARSEGVLFLLYYALRETLVLFTVSAESEEKPVWRSRSTSTTGRLPTAGRSRSSWKRQDFLTDSCPWT